MAKRCNHHHSIFPRFYLTCLVLFLNYKSSNFLDCIYTSSRSQIKSFVAHSEYLEAIESFESFQEAVVLCSVYVCIRKGWGWSCICKIGSNTLSPFSYFFLYSFGEEKRKAMFKKFFFSLVLIALYKLFKLF